MKITKILALLIALILCLSMVSCSGIFTKLFGNEGETESESASTEETEGVVTEGVDTSDELDETENIDDILGDLGEEEEGEKLPDGQVIYFEDFQSYGNTSDNSALDTLGWKKMTVKDDKVMAEADVEFDFENGRLHVNTWNAGEELIPGHAFYAITQLDDEVMSTVAAGGYTLQYDIAYTQDVAKANVLSSIIINFSENNWTDMAVRPTGVGLFENVTGGKAFLLGDSTMAATGDTVESSISGVLLNEVPSNKAPLLNLSVTVRVQVDPEKGPIFYVKKSEAPDTEFVKVGETVLSNGFVGWMAAKSKAVALHTCGGLNVYYDNLLVYSGLGECPVTIVPDGFNGEDAGNKEPNTEETDTEEIPDVEPIPLIYYYEDFNYADSFENNVMDLTTVEGISQELMQQLGITCVSDGGLTNYMWMDSGRLLISNYSGYEGDTREKDTTGKYSFFKIAGLDDAVKMAELCGNKYTVQYDVTYGWKDVVPNSGGLEQDMAAWEAMLDIILNMDGASGTACGITTGGGVRLDYLTTDESGTTNKLLTDASLMNRGTVIGKKLREGDVGALTIRIEVDPKKDTVTMYVKTANMNDFIVAATTSTTSEGYSSLVAATSNSIGFAIQYGANVLLDNLIVYSGYGNPPAIDNQENYYKAQ